MYSLNFNDNRLLSVIVNPELAYTCKCLSHYLVSLLFAEKNGLLIIVDFPLKIALRNAIHRHVEIYARSWILTMIGFTWLVTVSWIFKEKT